MSVKFKCNQSGNIFEFFSDHDINTMRKHPEYSEVQSTGEVLESIPPVEEEPVVELASASVGQPKRGRPPKLQKD